MRRNTIIAIAVIAIIGVGSVAAVLLLMQPPVPGLIIMGTTDSVEATVDPAQSYDYFGWEIIGSLGCGLVDIRPNSSASVDDIVPALATSWVFVSADTAWDFTLRQGVLFEDGTEFNATHVKFTYDRNINLTGDGLFEPDGFHLNMEIDTIIDSVEVVSEYVVRFNLFYNFAPFLQLMAAQAMYIVDHNVPKDELVTYTEGDARASHPNALGPFLLESWSRVGGSDDEMVLIRNPNYWNITGGFPIAEKIVIKFYASDSALAIAMAAGEVDIAYRHLTIPQILAFQDNPNIRVWEGIGAQIQYMLFQQRFYPFNETPVRMAIAAALNRTHVTDTVFRGLFQPLYTMIPEGMAYHKPSFEVHGSANYTFTIATLATYGYNAGNKLVIDLWYESSGHYPQSEEQALVYQADLEASGVITVNLHGAEWATYRLQRNAGTMPVFIYGWYPDYIDPDNYAFLPFANWLNLYYNSTSPAGGVAQYNLWLAGRSTIVDSERRTAYEDLQDLQAEEVSCIPLWQSTTYAISKPTIHGIILDITITWRPWMLYLGPPSLTGP